MEKTIKEGYINEEFGKINIDTFEDYKILKVFPASGGEADIFKVTKDNNAYILKLYRYGIEPPLDILNKIQELSNRFPEDLVRTIKQGYSQEHRRYYEILEEASLGNLRDYLKDKKATDYIIKEIINQVSNALLVLSQEGILHLDLKPENILVRSDRPFDLILSDFGMASLFDSSFSKKMTSIKGTDTYWSPEAATGFATDKSDYWSLGIIIYEIIAGEHPFRHLSQKLRNYEMNVKEISIPEDITEEYKTLLKGLLTKDPHKRWGGVEIKKWLNGEKVEEHFESSKKENTISLKYDNQYFYTMNELITHLSKKVNGRDELKKLFHRGHISNWFSRQGLVDEAMDIDDLRESNRKEAFDLFIKRYAPMFNPNPFNDFLNNLSIERIKYEYTKLKKTKKLPWVFVGVGTLFMTGAWVPLAILAAVFYFKGGITFNKRKIRFNNKKEINFDNLKNLGKKFKDEIHSEIKKEIDKNKNKKEWERVKKRELEKIRKKEIAKLRKKRRRGRTFKTLFVVGGIGYLATHSSIVLPGFITAQALAFQNFAFSVILPAFYKLIDIIVRIFTEIF